MLYHNIAKNPCFQIALSRMALSRRRRLSIVAACRIGDGASALCFPGCERCVAIALPRFRPKLRRVSPVASCRRYVLRASHPDLLQPHRFMRNDGPGLLPAVLVRLEHVHHRQLPGQRLQLYSMPDHHPVVGLSGLLSRFMLQIMTIMMFRYLAWHT